MEADDRILRMRFEELRLLPGERLQLTLTGSDHRRQQRPAIYIGCRAQHSVLVAPGAALMNTLRSGVKVTVSAVLPTGLASFHASVETTTQIPYPHCHLTMPGEVIVRQVRSAVRVPVSIAATLDNLDQPEHREVAVQLQDLSVSGAKCGTREELARLGDHVRLAFRLEVAHVARELAVDGWVRARPVADGVTGELPQVYGIEFGPLDDDLTVWLHAFVARELQHTGPAR